MCILYYSILLLYCLVLFCSVPCFSKKNTEHPEHHGTLFLATTFDTYGIGEPPIHFCYRHLMPVGIMTWAKKHPRIKHIMIPIGITYL